MSIGRIYWHFLIITAASRYLWSQRLRDTVKAL